MPDIVAGKYELLRKLGEGGMAQVHLARKKSIANIESLVVLKVIHPNVAQDPGFISMFLDEARTAADLNHRNVIQLIEVGEHDSTYFMVMEYLVGRNVREVWRKAGEMRQPIAWGNSLHIIIDAARGLEYAHNKADMRGNPLNIIHRDVSPQNLMVTRAGVTKLLDFGIAKASSKTTVTAPGLVRGKAGYMSPEQATGQDLDGRADQFSLAVVLYELTTGRRLFNKKTDSATLRAILDEPIAKPSSFTEYAKHLEQILMQALAKNREHRFSSCGAFADALDDFMRMERVPHSPRRVSKLMTILFGDELDDENTVPPAETPLDNDDTRTAQRQSASRVLPNDETTGIMAQVDRTDASFVAVVQDFLESQDDDD